MRRAKLRGASVAVTGGARGIGRETAARLRSAGARVVIGDLDHPVAEQTAAALGPDVAALPLDVADRGSFETFLAEAQRLHGPLDVLVSNAGVMPLGRFLDGDPGVFDRTLDVNFGGTVNALSLALPGMVERGHGRVVVVASLMGRVTVPGAAVYGASKYAVVALCEAVRRELRGTGVGLVTILPAMVRTELSSGVPEGRALPVVEPGRVARAIVRACADGRPEVAVPAWAGGFARIGGALPPSLMTPVRRMLGDERALTQIDEERRRMYEERIRSG
jgi:NAD(P)-dependent dehydrogenase (short-subunit alcohol dehydrogenase family)